MSTFATPAPITLVLEVSEGRVLIAASDRTDTVVQLRSGNGATTFDAGTTEQLDVAYADGRLVVKTPTRTGLKNLLGSDQPIDVTIELPTGSGLELQTSNAEIRAEGQLGECRLSTSTGQIRLDRTGPLHADTAGGPISIEHVAGDAEVNGSSGNVRLGAIDGRAVIMGANGEIWVGDATGNLDLATANGDIHVGRAGANVTIKTAKGNIRVGRLTRGQVELMTATGVVDIGIGSGSAAWIDAESTTGSVENSLAVQDDPDEFANKVEVRARTRSGDIVIRRAS